MTFCTVSYSSVDGTIVIENTDRGVIRVNRFPAYYVSKKFILSVQKDRV